MCIIILFGDGVPLKDIIVSQKVRYILGASMR